MTDETLCISCRRPKASLSCGVCEEPTCKDCIHYLEPTAFSFLKVIPDDLKHDRFCTFCYEQKVAPALESYLEIMERAKGVYVFFTTQRKSFPLLKRSKDKVRVLDCPDRDETILRLAFLAAEQSYNALLDVDVTCEKIRTDNYQKSKWQGVGVPATVDAEKLEYKSEFVTRKGRR
jgi:hypothetical protein